MINKVIGIHPKDRSIPYTECLEPVDYYLENLIMGVFFVHDGDYSERIFLYDLSNLIENINFVQKTVIHNILPIDSLLLKGGTLNIKWRACNPYTPYENHSIESNGILYMGSASKNFFTNPSHKKPEPTATIIFPLVETNAEWKDRMHRILSFCAHQLEDALSKITPQLYQRSDDAHYCPKHLSLIHI